MKIRIQIDEEGQLPTRGKELDAGWDLYTSQRTQVAPPKERDDRRPQDWYGSSVNLPTGVRVCIPKGWYGLILPRSSSRKLGLLVIPAVIDAGYTGPLFVQVTTAPERSHSVYVEKGQRVAQLLIQRVPEVEWEVTDHFAPTARGSAGFGSTGL